MKSTPPIPETSVSLYVWVLVGLTAFVVILTLLVVRRRHNLLLSLTMGLVTAVVVSVSTLYLILPPQVPSRDQPRLQQTCPYDRMVWSNMRTDVDEAWQPCRQTSRTQLAMVMLGIATLTMGVANLGLQLTVPTRDRVKTDHAAPRGPGAVAQTPEPASVLAGSPLFPGPAG